MKNYLYPTVLSISGSDNVGIAGIQADIQTITALGAHAITVSSAIGIRSKAGIKVVHSIPPEIIRQQIEHVMENALPDVVKIGLIGNIESAKIIADCLRKYHPRYVVYDPAILIYAGSNLSNNEVTKVIKNELLRYINLMTINLSEAKAFTGMKVVTKNDLKRMTHILSERYSIPIIVKGGNLLNNSTYDVLQIPDGKTYEYIGQEIPAQYVEQASSVFSAGIATFLAQEKNLDIAIKHAREFVDKVLTEEMAKEQLKTAVNQ